MKNLLIAVLVCITLNSFGQYVLPKKADAEKVLKSKLIVQLLDEKSDVDKNYNICMKTSFEKNWKLTELAFMDKEEIDKILKSKKEGYAILSQSDAERKLVRTKYMGPDGKMVSFAEAPVGSSKVEFTKLLFSYYNFKLDVIQGSKIIEVTNLGFANGELTSVDFLFLCQQLTQLLDFAVKSPDAKNYSNVDANLEKCKKSKLILLKDFFREKDQAEMKSYCDYDFKLVDRVEYQDIILNQNPGNAYVKIIWSNQHQNYIWVVVDAENGKILARTAFGGVKFGTYQSADDIIKAKHIKYVYNKTAQNLNNRYQ